MNTESYEQKRFWSGENLQAKTALQHPIQLSKLRRFCLLLDRTGCLGSMHFSDNSNSCKIRRLQEKPIITPRKPITLQKMLAVLNII